MRLSILSNVNLDMLSGLLKKENEVFQTDGYGEWITYALKKSGRNISVREMQVIWHRHPAPVGIRF